MFSILFIVFIIISTYAVTFQYCCENRLSQRKKTTKMLKVGEGRGKQRSVYFLAQFIRDKAIK